MNLLILLLSALVPLVIGFIWYNPKVLGTAWMKSAGLTEEQLKGSNMLLIFGLTYFFSFLAATVITGLVIHQNAIYSVLANEEGFGIPGSAMQTYIDDFMKNYGQNFRTFKHGMLHGGLTAIFFVMPIVGINALFERKGFKYIMIHVGYWFISLMIMGGIICQFS
jgi:hypothetical protein